MCLRDRAVGDQAAGDDEVVFLRIGLRGHGRGSGFGVGGRPRFLAARLQVGQGLLVERVRETLFHQVLQRVVDARPAFRLSLIHI